MSAPENLDYVAKRIERLASAFSALRNLIKAGELAEAEDLAEIFDDYAMETMAALKAHPLVQLQKDRKS